jgi:hypothetical protein
MAKRPNEDTAVAKYIGQRVLELKAKKSQMEIASEAGFVNPNMMAMLKSGATKVPLDRVPMLARALECDPAFLMRLTLEQVVGAPGAGALIDILGSPVSRNEAAWLDEIRDASGNCDPRPTTRSRTALRAIFGK